MSEESGFAHKGDLNQIPLIKSAQSGSELSIQHLQLYTAGGKGWKRLQNANIGKDLLTRAPLAQDTTAKLINGTISNLKASAHKTKLITYRM